MKAKNLRVNIERLGSDKFKVTITKLHVATDNKSYLDILLPDLNSKMITFKILYQKYIVKTVALEVDGATLDLLEYNLKEIKNETVFRITRKGNLGWGS